MAKPKPKQAPDYEQLKGELESILDELQQEDLDIDRALDHYKRGLELIKRLENYLDTADNTVKELKAKFNARAK